LGSHGSLLWLWHGTHGLWNRLPARTSTPTGRITMNARTHSWHQT